MNFDGKDLVLHSNSTKPNASWFDADVPLNMTMVNGHYSENGTDAAWSAAKLPWNASETIPPLPEVTFNFRWMDQASFFMDLFLVIGAISLVVTAISSRLVTHVRMRFQKFGAEIEIGIVAKENARQVNAETPDLELA